MNYSLNGFKRRALPLAIGLAVMQGAIAQQALVLEEIVVTATKRAESIQDVPLAITAMSGEFTQKINLNDVKDLVSFTPGITGNSQDSFIDAISVRGIRTQDFGVGGDPSAAFFKNELYEGRNGSAVTSLYDMERSEVLRGPQGFLFGRNSIGGAISVHTRRAELGDDISGYVEVDIAERHHLVIEGAINVPVNDKFAMRFAGFTSEEDGFADNLTPGNSRDLIEHEKEGLRWSTTYKDGALQVFTFVEYENRKQSGSVYRAVQEGDIWDTFTASVSPGLTLRGNDEELDSDQTSGDRDDADVLTLGVKLEYDFDAFTLTSNTGYKDHEYFYTEDYDGTPLNISDYSQEQEGDYIQQEFRITSNTDNALSWYAGVSYYKEEIDADFTFVGDEDNFCAYYGNYYNPGNNFTGCADLYAYYGSPFTATDGKLRESGRIKGEFSGWAAYVDVDYAINENWNIGLGVRYTDDTKDFALSVPTPTSDLGAYWAYGFSTDGFIADEESWDDVTTRVLVRYQPDDGGMWFASFTEGFKSGGFGSFNLDNDAAGNPAVGNVELTQADGFPNNVFDPETVDSWEIGYKNSLFDGRANFDFTAFTYDYEDLQVVVFDGGASIVKNVGEVEAYGFETSITAKLTETYKLMFAVGYLDSEASKLQSICGLPDVNGCEDSNIFWAPDWSGSLVLDGAWSLKHGTITASLEMFWETERGGGWEGLDSTEIDAYEEFALRIGFESNDNWHGDLYVENLTDEFTWDGENNNGGVLPSHFFGPKRPRTVGLRLGMEF